MAIAYRPAKPHHRLSRIGWPRLRRGSLTDSGINLTLLGSPFLFHVRLTLKKTVAEHEAAIDEEFCQAAPIGAA